MRMTKKGVVKRALSYLIAVCFSIGAALLVDSTQVKAQEDIAITEVTFRVDFSKLSSVVVGAQIPDNTIRVESDRYNAVIIVGDSTSHYYNWAEGWTSKQNESDGLTQIINNANNHCYASNKFDSQCIYGFGCDIFPDVGYYFSDDVNISCSNASFDIIEKSGNCISISAELGKVSDIIKKSGSGTVATTSTSTSGKVCDHEYEWVEDVAATADSDAKLVHKCKKCGNIDMRMTEANSAFVEFLRESADKITKASANATVKIEAKNWSSFQRTIIDALSKRPDVTLVIEYTDTDSSRHQITIPAGTDLSDFIDANGYTGFDFLISKGLETDYWASRLNK